MSTDGKALKEAALRLLVRREHSRAELSQKLFQRGFGASEIQQILNQLIAEGSLSEQRFSEMYICSRMRKGYGPIRIEQELISRGVDVELYRPLLLEQAESWSEIAQQVYDKKFGNCSAENYNEYAKRLRFMEQRGFDSKLIMSVVKTYEE